MTFGDNRRGPRRWRARREAPTIEAMDGADLSDGGRLHAGAREITGRIELVPGAREITHRIELVHGAREISPHGERGQRTRPTEVTRSELIPGAREITGRIELVPSAREITGRIELVPGAREITLRDDIVPAGTPGARPPRDLVRRPKGRMSFMELDAGTKPKIPPDKNLEPPWDPAEAKAFIEAHFRYWVQHVVQNDGNGKAPWSHRDGATLCTLDGPGGRFLLIGGWDSSQEPHDHWISNWATDDFEKIDEIPYGRALTTNEVWGTDNFGKTWDLRLGHKKFNKLDDAQKAVRFPRVHTPAWAYCDGHFYLIGGDVYVPHSQVWRTPLSGDGTEWQFVNEIPAPWDNRILSIAGSINDNLYAMGGQITVDPTTASNDVFELKKGEANWHRMSGPPPSNPKVGKKPWPPWKPRGMVYGMPVITNKDTSKDELYLVGGGIFNSEVYFDDVWRFDGTDWSRVPPKPAPGASPGWPTGLAAPATSGRRYHNVVLTAPGPDWPDGLIWIITGSMETQHSSKPILISKNLGATWEILMMADWGIHGSHADGVTVWNRTEIFRATGNAFDRSTYRIHQISLAELPFQPVAPRVDGFENPANPTGPLLREFFGPPNAVVKLKGANLDGAVAVYLDPTQVNLVYVEHTIVDAETLTLSMVEVPGLNPGDPPAPRVFIVVVGVAGSSDYANAHFTYKS